MSRDPRALRRSWLPWIPLVLVAVLALVIGALGSTGPSTNQDRTLAIAKVLRCPVCNGETVAESNVDTSRLIREDIARRVEQGQSDQEIIAYLDRQYDGIALTPSASGAAGLVWFLPVAALVVALAGLAVAFRRWGEPSGTTATDEDRALVAHALDEPGTDQP